MPADMPKCGFDGGLCDYTIFYVLFGILLFMGIAVPAGYYLHRKEKERMLYDMTWLVSSIFGHNLGIFRRIPREQVRLLEARYGKVDSRK
jgi:hypothetical protein